MSTGVSWNVFKGPVGMKGSSIAATGPTNELTYDMTPGNSTAGGLNSHTVQVDAEHPVDMLTELWHRPRRSVSIRRPSLEPAQSGSGSDVMKFDYGESGANTATPSAGTSVRGKVQLKEEEKRENREDFAATSALFSGQGIAPIRPPPPAPQMPGQSPFAMTGPIPSLEMSPDRASSANPSEVYSHVIEIDADHPVDLLTEMWHRPRRSISLVRRGSSDSFASRRLSTSSQRDGTPEVAVPSNHVEPAAPVPPASQPGQGAPIAPPQASPAASVKAPAEHASQSPATPAPAKAGSGIFALARRSSSEGRKSADGSRSADRRSADRRSAEPKLSDPALIGKFEKAKERSVEVMPVVSDIQVEAPPAAPSKADADISSRAVAPEEEPGAWDKSPYAMEDAGKSGKVPSKGPFSCFCFGRPAVTA